MKDIDLNKLRIFQEVVRSGSFGKAAQALKQPKSKVSRNISALESELGVQLIYRTTRQFRLTQAGLDLVARLGPLMRDLDLTLDEISTDSKEIAGQIKITAPEDIAKEILGGLCHEFMQLHPKIQIGLHAGNQVVDLIKESIDLAVRIGPVKDSAMKQKKLGSVGVSLVISPKLYARYRPKTVKDLEAIPYLAYDHDDLRLRNVKFTRGGETQSIRVKPYFASNNFFVLRSMAIKDAGLAMIPSFLVRDHIARGELIQLFKDWRGDVRSIQLLLPAQKELPVRLRKFLDFIAPKLAEAFSE